MIEHNLIDFTSSLNVLLATRSGQACFFMGVRIKSV